MKENDLLINRLIEYSKSSVTPMHMPGHKRKEDSVFNPYSIDITEIDGFDNLHNPDGILLDSMNWASKIYNSRRTFYLVNGSSCGVLSAICAATSADGNILLARNSHKSAYHAADLCHLHITNVYPELISDFNINGSISPEKIKDALDNNASIEAVFIVSPTYEGIISDIKSIAQICHSHNVPLIVDEAHGAHLSFNSKDNPQSAITLGADIAIQSLHKTLNAFTQTAVLHFNSEIIDIEKVKYYLQLFQSSSPSYILMSSIEKCIFDMDKDGTNRLDILHERINSLRNELKALNHLKLLDVRERQNAEESYAFDNTRLTVFSPVSGLKLADILRKKYNIEVEMAGPDYCIFILTVNDTLESINILINALIDIDKNFSDYIDDDNRIKNKTDISYLIPVPKINCTINHALHSKSKEIKISDSLDQTSAEYAYIYPPGIPLIVPGEIISKDIIDAINYYKNNNYSILGLSDTTSDKIRILD